MAYNIKFKNSVLKDLKKLDKFKAIEILNKIDTELSINADKSTVLKGKFSGLRIFRVGDYRILFTIIGNDSVLILCIAHRKEAYRK